MLSGLKARQQVVGFAQMGDDEDTGLAIDATGFDDAPIAVASNADALDARHVVSIYITTLASQGAQAATNPGYNTGKLSGESTGGRGIFFLLFVYTDGEEKREAAYEEKSPKTIAVTTLQR